MEKVSRRKFVATAVVAGATAVLRPPAFAFENQGHGAVTAIAGPVTHEIIAPQASPFLPVVPVIPNNPAQGWCGSGKHCGVPNRSHGGIVFQVGVHEVRAVSEEPIESTLVLAAESSQVVVAELID
jgi:hypothetical protein